MKFQIYEKRNRDDLQRSLKIKELERDDHATRTDRLKEYIEQNKTKLKQYEKQKLELEQEVQNADQGSFFLYILWKSLNRPSNCSQVFYFLENFWKCINQTNYDLEQVMNKLGSASVEKTESRRQQRRNELVEKLKSLYPGQFKNSGFFENILKRQIKFIDQKRFWSLE